jgi:hypothetical protein
VQVQIVAKNLQQHLLLLLPVCSEIIKLATAILQSSQPDNVDFHTQLEGKSGQRSKTNDQQRSTDLYYLTWRNY